MRYRVQMRGCPPMEFECFRFEFDKQASSRKINLFDHDAKHARDYLSIHLPCTPTIIRDDHGRIVWSERTYIELSEHQVSASAH